MANANSSLREEQDSAAEMPFCSKPEDFYTQRARRTLYRLIPDFFIKHNITVTEVLHRADMLSKMENTGTVLLHAVQMAAVERACATKVPVSDVLKQINQLVSLGYDRIQKDKRNNVFPMADADGFGALADRLATAPNGTYLLNGALAMYLRDTDTWNEKTMRLLALMEQPRRNGPGSEMLCAAIDEILAEIVATPAAMRDVIGPKKAFGETLLALVHLFLGQAKIGQYGERQGLDGLARHFAVDELPVSRDSLSRQIVADLRCLKRLCDDSAEAEMRLFREISVAIQQGVGAYLSRMDLMAALELRSARFVAPQTLSKCLSVTILPDEKIEWLFFAERCVVGARSKYFLADNILRIATAGSFAQRFHQTQIPLSKRLHRLAALNAHAYGSGFDADLRLKIADVFDGIACDIARQAKLFETIDAQSSSPARKAMTILKMFDARDLTESRLAQTARARVISYLTQPDFLAGYMKFRFDTDGTSLGQDAAKRELTKSLQNIGIARQTCLKTFADVA